MAILELSKANRSGVLFSALVVAGVLPTIPCRGESEQRSSLQAGAAIVDVTPQTMPVIVNGSMRSRTVDTIKTRLKARSLALSDGASTVAMVVVDSCMMPRPLLDEVKQQAFQRTGIPTDHILISATHTHSAGSCMGALGTPADSNYVPLLKMRLVDAIEAAAARLQPARIGFGRASAPEFTAVRRWIRRPDRLADDPFGNPTVRANMHAAQNPDDVTGPSGPEDPELSLISVQTLDGQPLAVLANFSMHYFGGEQGISADYFGLFCAGLKQRIAPNGSFVGIMSHGCSGDIWRRDYARRDSWERLSDIEDYAEGLTDAAVRILDGVEYRDDVDLAMSEHRMTLKYRVPDKQRLLWSQEIVKRMGDRLPETSEEIYANEQVILHERQQTEVVTQAIRIGDIAIATTPNETYAVTGLKIKAASPLEKTMVIELANGGDGYIPPPEQHLFGGYNTWAARSAGLEVTAEPKIAASCVKLLERVAGAPRRRPKQSCGPAAEIIEESRPLAWYRLDEFSGPRAIDSTSNRLDGIYESHVTYYLEGPRSEQFCAAGEANRAAMFVGGRLRTRHPQLGPTWSASLWCWNGMPDDARPVSGWLLSQGDDHSLVAASTHLGVGSADGRPGRLILQFGDNEASTVAGTSVIPRWTWQHIVLSCAEDTIRVYLNGNLEISAAQASPAAYQFEHLFFGGRTDNSANWEGRLDEIAVFDRALTADEVARLADSD